MRKSLRKTFNRVDRGKCDIAYVGKKLEAELIRLRWADCDDHVKYRMFISSAWKGEERTISLLTYDNDADVEWVLPGGWILRYSSLLEEEAGMVYKMFDKHYNRGDR